VFRLAVPSLLSSPLLPFARVLLRFTASEDARRVRYIIVGRLSRTNRELGSKWKIEGILTDLDTSIARLSEYLAVLRAIGARSERAKEHIALDNSSQGAGAGK
jgi:hypothetical protein